jgi:hypothetical protein
MKQTYRVLAGLIAVGVVVQAGALAYGWFSLLHQLDNGRTIGKSYDGNAGHALHGIVGTAVIPLLALVLLGVAFFAKIEKGIALAGALVASIVLQIALAFIGFSVAFVGALHGINALVVLGVAVAAARQAQTSMTTVPVETREAAAV